MYQEYLWSLGQKTDSVLIQGGDDIRESLDAYCRCTGNEALLRQWHPDKNEPLTPDTVSRGSSRRVWWRCEKGHEWQAMVKSRVSGCGCPVCANRAIRRGDNDLATTHPGLAGQWHPTKNGGLTPETVSPYSNRKVWWVCERGHPYQAVVAARTMHSSGCPVCAGRVKSEQQKRYAAAMAGHLANGGRSV